MPIAWPALYWTYLPGRIFGSPLFYREEGLPYVPMGFPGWSVACLVHTLIAVAVWAFILAICWLRNRATSNQLPEPTAGRRDGRI